MKLTKRRIRLYITMYVIIAVLAVLGLLVNINTIPINDKIQSLSRQVKAVRDENQTLKLALLSETRLERVDQIATEQLHMGPPTQVIYVRQKEKQNVFSHAAP
ncbi:hypothetical protein EBR96_06680 [bacterium]|nr:hypothetical protein [bacterium]